VEPDERVHALLKCRSASRRAVLAVTDRRVIIANKRFHGVVMGPLGGERYLEMPLAEIESARLVSNGTYGRAMELQTHRFGPVVITTGYSLGSALQTVAEMIHDLAVKAGRQREVDIVREGTASSELPPWKRPC
jgi:hypothetical protein